MLSDENMLVCRLLLAGDILVGFRVGGDQGDRSDKEERAVRSGYRVGGIWCTTRSIGIHLTKADRQLEPEGVHLERGEVDGKRRS